MTRSQYSLEALLPHAAPMILLDRVNGIRDDVIEAEVRVHAGTPFFVAGQGVRAHVAIEWMAQACGAYVGARACDDGLPVRIGLLLGTRDFSATRTWLAEGLSFKVFARISYFDNEMGVFDCSVRDASSDDLVAAAQLTVYQPNDITTLISPEGIVLRS